MHAWMLIVGCAAVIAPLAAPVCAQSGLHSAPLELIHGKPFVTVLVDGQGPFRFVIDTGTGAEAFVTAELATRLGLPVVGQARLNDPSGQGGRRAPMVLLRRLSVAGVEFSDVRAVEHELGGPGEHYDGLLGFTLFRDCLLTLDFPNRRMTLAAGSLAPDGNLTVLNFRMPDGVPIVPIRIDGLHLEAQIDSGGGGLSLPEQLVSRLRFDSQPQAFGNGQSLATRFQIKSARLAVNVNVAVYIFKQPFVELNPAFPLANFGAYPMQSFALTFDQKKLLMKLSARHKTLRLAATPTPLELKNAPSDRSPDISLVPVG